METGEFLKQYRQYHGIKAAAMARKLGVDYWRYLKWESGRSKPNHEDQKTVNAWFGMDIRNEEPPIQPNAGELQAQITQLKEQLHFLQERIASLEDKLASR